VELRFAKIERDVIARGIFTSVNDLSRKLMKYIRTYAEFARPFRWTYSDPKRFTSLLSQWFVNEVRAGGT
jgi:hypothetical protein